jgi:hypothetical protein
MKRVEWILVALAAVGSAYVWAATQQPLVWSRVYWWEEAFGPDLSDPPATTPPIGRACSYVTFSGVRTVIVLGHDYHTFVRELEAEGGSVDPQVRLAIPLSNWSYTSDCPPTLPSAVRRAT